MASSPLFSLYDGHRLMLWILVFACVNKQPNLYILVLSLKDATGQVVDCESCLVGIRQVSKAPKQLLVNGHPVILRGVNRHEHHPRVGKTNIESCMIKVTSSPSLLVSYLCFIGWRFIWFIMEMLSILLLTGSGSNEAKQYECCEEQSLSPAPSLVRVVRSFWHVHDR
jgi:hypothetical protein